MADTYKPQGTYNDVGLSPEDLAKVNAYKSQWQNAYNAGDQSGMDAAHAGAEAVRSKYNYSGGGDGSQYIALATDKPSAIAGATPDTLTPATSQETYVNSLYDAQREANIQALKSAYDRNMAALDAQAAKIPAIYRDAENRTASADAINRANFNEYAAASGLNSGTAGQAQLAMNNQLLSEQSALQRARAEALNDVETARTQARMDYKNAVAQAIKDGNLQRAQALYDEAVRVDNSLVSTALDQAQLNYQYWMGNSQLESDYQNRLMDYNDRLRASAQAEVNAILARGGTPSAELLKQAGYSQEYINSMQTPAYGGASYGGMYYNYAEPESEVETTLEPVEQNVAPGSLAAGVTVGSTYPAGTVQGKTWAEYDAAAGNYQSVKSALDARKANGASTQDILKAVRAAYDSGVLNMNDYMSLYNRYRG